MNTQHCHFLSFPFLFYITLQVHLNSLSSRSSYSFLFFSFDLLIDSTSPHSNIHRRSFMHFNFLAPPGHFTTLLSFMHRLLFHFFFPWARAMLLITIINHLLPLSAFSFVCRYIFVFSWALLKYLGTRVLLASNTVFCDQPDIHSKKRKTSH